MQRVPAGWGKIGILVTTKQCLNLKENYRDTMEDFKYKYQSHLQGDFFYVAPEEASQDPHVKGKRKC